jgi:hypothetical protein
MKNLIYHLLLLIFIAVLTGFLLATGKDIPMAQMLGFGGALVLYIVGASLVGESGTKEDREKLHITFSNRAGLIAGQIVLAIGILYQLFVTHNIDYWLLVGLIAISLTKIISLIYLTNNKPVDPSPNEQN